MEDLKRIRIAGTEYPYRIDLNVLERIQEIYGEIHRFEMDILGLRYLKDKDGKQIYDKDGEPRMRSAEPSVHAIRRVLPLMINEGLEIESEITGKPWEPVTEKELARNCDVAYEYLAELIHEEYKRCFVTKKPVPGKEEVTAGSTFPG